MSMGSRIYPGISKRNYKGGHFLRYGFPLFPSSPFVIRTQKVVISVRKELGTEEVCHTCCACIFGG